MINVGEIPERFIMNKLFIMLLSVVVVIGCSEKKKEVKNTTEEVKVNLPECGKVNIKGAGDPLEDAVVVDTTKYCKNESLYNNISFLSLFFKKPPVQTEQTFSVSVYFTDGDADSYWRARFILSGKLISVAPEEVRIDDNCDLEDKCVKRKGFSFFVKRDVMEFWAANGGTIRFGEKTDITIDKNEAKDFLDQVDKITVGL